MLSDWSESFFFLLPPLLSLLPFFLKHLKIDFRDRGREWERKKERKKH